MSAAARSRWRPLTSLILTSVFFQSLKPSDPYLSHFFKDVKGFGVEQMSHHIWPFYTYGLLAGLAPFTFIAEYIVDYHHVILTGIACRVLSQYLLLSSSSLLTVQIAELTFGLASSTKIINGAFVYTVVPDDTFMKITGWLRASNLSANVLGGVAAWMCRQHFRLPYDILFYMSIVSTFTGFVLFAAAMPIRAKRDRPLTIAARLSRFRIQFQECRRALCGNTSVLLWSVWIWIANSSSELVMNMDTTLFKEISSQDQTNGLVLAACRISACTAAIATAKYGNFFQIHALYSVLIASTCAGILLAIAASSTIIQISHICIILYYAINEISGCVATSQVARNTDDSIRLLLLFLNMFVSQLLQTILHISMGPKFLNVKLRKKFIVLATLMYSLAIGVLLVSIANRRRTRSQSKDINLKTIHA